jgi:hypothetical protein
MSRTRLTRRVFSRVAALSGLAAMAPFAARAADEWSEIVIYVERGALIDAATPPATIGHQVVHRSSFRYEPGGNVVGKATELHTIVAIDEPGDLPEARLVQVEYAWDSGETLIAAGVASFLRGSLHTDPARMAIVGGSGAFAAARGEIVVQPARDGYAQITLRLLA